MTLRTAEQSRAGMIGFVEARGSGIRTDGGQPIVDVIDAVAVESARQNVKIDYATRINSIAGWRTIISDEAFKRDLAEAWGIGYDRASADYLREIGAPADMPSDVEGRIHVELGNFAASFNRPRRAATPAKSIERLYLSSTDPYTLTRGATMRRGGSSGLLYDTSADLSAVTPSTEIGTGLPYVDVAIKCRTPGRAGNAVVGSIRSTSGGTLTGVTAVKNITAAEGGRDRETNLELLNALPGALLGTNINTEEGLIAFLEGQPDVEGAIAIMPGDPLMTRTEAGAVDVYVIGSRLTSVQAVTTIGEIGDAGEAFTLPLQPVISVASARDDSSNEFFPGGGFDFVPDEGPVAGSMRAHAQVVWDLPAPDGAGPEAGARVTIAYTHDALTRDLQRMIDEDPRLRVPASGILVRRAPKVGVTIQMLVVPIAGLEDLDLTPADVNLAVQNALAAYVNAFTFAQELDFSTAEEVAGDAIINGVSVVDHIDGFAMGETGSPAGYENVRPGGNEYLRLDAVNFLG